MVLQNVEVAKIRKKLIFIWENYKNKKYQIQRQS